jgi:RHS repeat-associated protein
VQKYAYCYHYDASGNVLCETDAAGNVIRSYAYDLSGHPIAFTQDLGQGPQTFYIHTNARGDVVCITDDVQNWVKKYTYDPWGNITTETSSSGLYDALDSHYACAGYFRDAETGLYYMPARYYSPAQRRFITKDPHPGSKSNPLTLNPYQYCKNNPVNNVDPSGQYDIYFDVFGFGNKMKSIMKGVGPINYTPGINVGNCGVSNFIAAQDLFRAAGPGLNHFASSMASFNTSVHRNLAGFRAPSFSGMGGALSYLHGLAVGKAFVKGMNAILKPFSDLAFSARCRELRMSEARSGGFWGIIDKTVTGLVIATDWIGASLQPFGVGYLISGVSSVLSTGQDLVHVFAGDMDWGGFMGRRIVDGIGYIIPGPDVTNVVKTGVAIDDIVE